MTVLFKFKHDAPDKSRKEAMQQIEQRFGVNCVPMFTNSEGTELADVFTIEVPTKHTKVAVDELSKLQPIEFAEVPPERHLVRTD